MRAGIGVIASAHVDSAPAGYVLVNDDCDNFTDAPWTVNGSVTVTASGQTGNGFNFPSGGTNFLTYNLATIDQRDTLTLGLHIRLATLSGSADVLRFYSDAGVTQHVVLRTGTNGSFTVLRGGSSQLGSGAPAGTIAINTWYFIEFQAVLHDTTGSVAVRVNGTPIAGVGGTNIDTKNAGTKAVFDQVRINSYGSSGNWQIDNVYIRNDTTFGP